MIKVLWATKIGAADWQEQVITETSDPAKLEAAAQWAKANGFDRLRVLNLDGSKPDFVGAIRKQAAPAGEKG